MAGVPSDLVSRPELSYCMVAGTVEVERLHVLYTVRSVVAWTGEGQHVDLNTIADDVHSAYRIHRNDIQVTKYHLENFFLTFTIHGDREAVLQETRLVTRSGREYFFRPWDEKKNAEAADIIEGVPMHARTEDSVAKLIGPWCSVHYIEEDTRRRNYNRTFDVWVWTSDPSSIPKVLRLTVTRPDEEGHPMNTPFPDLEPEQPAPREPKKGLTYPVIIHVD